MTLSRDLKEIHELIFSTCMLKTTPYKKAHDQTLFIVSFIGEVISNANWTNTHYAVPEKPTNRLYTGKTGKEDSLSLFVFCIHMRYVLIYICSLFFRLYFKRPLM